MNIAFVLLTHEPDEPAGIERALASLADGLGELGHRVLFVAAGPPSASDGPGLVRLKTLTLPRPMLVDQVLSLLPSPLPVQREIESVLREQDIDLVCWADAVAGLGYLSPAPPGVRTALMVHFMRTDESMKQSLEHKPGVVLPVSDYLTRDSARAGVDTTGWRALPNAVPARSDPPSADVREQLRRTGPVRTLARADPQKGIAQLLEAFPEEGIGRPVQIILATARFEFWPGMQEDVLDECRRLADRLPDVEILPRIPWQDVQGFLAGASVALAPSVEPETFGNVAAEALSVGTPVVGYALGHLPVLVGEAGRLVDLSDGPGRLWAQVRELVDDAPAYHALSRQAVSQATGLTPVAVARTFLALTAPTAAP
ncbi:glycosyltransferase family 4 protein [Streptomyces sp. NPDC006649]|uniref:glycosyltransferase family 4 protein n=1 Tax=Streptomyces sp. NPDC006649 TaxID=3156896 RepID=UPI0033B7C0D9